jgi:hypothetical protein
MIKSRRVIWAGHVERTGEMRNTFWMESLKEGNYSEDQDLDGRIILKFILRNWV